MRCTEPRLSGPAKPVCWSVPSRLREQPAVPGTRSCEARIPRCNTRAGTAPRENTFTRHALGIETKEASNGEHLETCGDWMRAGRRAGCGGGGAVVCAGRLCQPLFVHGPAGLRGI